MELRTPNNNGGVPKPETESLHVNDKTPYHTQEAHVTSSLFDEIDSTCSTPYVSAPSSPGRESGNGGFYYSAPASPMHFALTSSYAVNMSPDNNGGGLGFEFGSGWSGATGSSMSSADELFLNGKIRPMKLSTHLEKPQVLAPLLDVEQEEEEEESEELVSRGRDLRVARDKSMRRRTRSLSPLRSTFSKWNTNDDDNNNNNHEEEAKEKPQQQHKSASCLDNKEMKPNNVHELPEAEVEAASLSASSSRSSSAGSRSTSKRWVFLKDFLRSKSEGRSNNKYFWLPTKDKKQPPPTNPASFNSKEKDQNQTSASSSSSSSFMSSSENVKQKVIKKPVNGITGKRRVPPSPHELHYTANRAQAEEMKKKTFLPYKQGLLGCLGFSSKGYGAMNGFTRALNPVSSR